MEKIPWECNKLTFECVKKKKLTEIRARSVIDTNKHFTMELTYQNIIIITGYEFNNRFKIYKQKLKKHSRNTN